MSSTEAPIEAPPEIPQPPRKGLHRSRIAVIAAGSLVALAGIGVGTTMALDSSTTNSPAASQSTTSPYTQKVTSILAPVLSANQSLSSALQGMDGSQTPIHNAQSAVQNAQTALTSARGAIAALTVPPSESALSQNVTQALTEENGYLQAVSSTLTDPVGQNNGDVRSLATNTQSAFVAIAQVAPGGSASISGLDNFLGWVSGAKRAATPKPQVNNYYSNTTTTTNDVVPDSNGGNSGSADSSSGDPTAGLVNQEPGIWSTSAISNALANNVFYKYWTNWNSTQGTPSASFQAWSADTQQWYPVNCAADSSGDGYVDCNVSGTTDPNAEVVIGQGGLDSYTQAQANAYASSPNSGPQG